MQPAGTPGTAVAADEAAARAVPFDVAISADACLLVALATRP